MKKISMGKIIGIVLLLALVGYVLYLIFRPVPQLMSFAQAQGMLTGNCKLDTSKSNTATAIGSGYLVILHLTGNCMFDGKQVSYIEFSLPFNDPTVASWFNNQSIQVQNASDNSFIWYIAIQVLGMFLIGWLIYSSVKRSQAGGIGGMFGANGGAKGFKVNASSVKFTDVAGIDEEKTELEEIIDYLKRPEKYNQMGVRMPKGVLLAGSPGTGKTLLAKAVAGEANVPFFSASGSDFEEVFVGLGASKIRDLFAKAKKAAPCIIFIDEVDAIGKARTSSPVGGEQAHEQTLNQLLSEMDGFGTNLGVIIIAATNRLEVLDSAMTRPGRFDRIIQVALPDIKGREAILKVHARDKNISSKVDMKEIARRTPGFSGAQLANILNEAGLLAVRNNKLAIGLEEIDEAIDRTIGGLAKKSKVITQSEKELVAYHEAGHALVGLNLKNASKVEKITIIPRGQAGGYTIMNPENEKFIMSKLDLSEMIVGYMGGRAAEQAIYGDDLVTSGASNDFSVATKIARRMVTEFGMTEIGLAQYESGIDAYRPYVQKPYGNTVSNKIDEKVEEILADAFKRAKEIIGKNKKELKLIAETLLILETITGPQIKYIHETLKMPNEALDAMKEMKDKKAADAKMAKEEKSETKTDTPSEMTSVDNEKSETTTKKTKITKKSSKSKQVKN